MFSKGLFIHDLSKQEFHAPLPWPFSSKTISRRQKRCTIIKKNTFFFSEWQSLEWYKKSIPLQQFNSTLKIENEVGLKDAQSPAFFYILAPGIKKDVYIRNRMVDLKAVREKILWKAPCSTIANQRNHPPPHPSTWCPVTWSRKKSNGLKKVTQNAARPM